MSKGYIEDRSQIRPIRDEIWALVQSAPNMAAVHWLTALDDCFENDEFHFDDFANMRWRLMALNSKVNLRKLYWLIEEVIPVNELADGLENYNKSDSAEEVL